MANTTTYNNVVDHDDNDNDNATTLRPTTYQQQLDQQCNDYITSDRVTNPYIALVCHHNLNRSMESHSTLHSNNYINIYSYGVGKQIRIPGETRDTPHVYEFGTTTYQHIYNDLSHKNIERYTKNGILWMLNRNIKIKQKPQKFQSEHKIKFDIIICFEQRVFDSLYNDITQRIDNIVNSNMYDTIQLQPCYILNIDTVDNHTEASNSAQLVLKLCNMLIKDNNNNNTWQSNITQIIDTFTQQNNKQVVYTLVYY